MLPEKPTKKFNLIIKTPSITDTTNRTNYHDNIDNEIKRTAKGFDCNSTLASDIARVLISIVKLIGEDTQWSTFMEYYRRILLMMIQERLFVES